MNSKKCPRWRGITAICGGTAVLLTLSGCVYGPGYYPSHYREGYYGGPYASEPSSRSYYYAPHRYYYPPASYYGY